MTIMTTRTAPAGARFSRPSASHLAVVDTMLARAAAFGGGGRIMASATDTVPPDPAPAAPAAPSAPADTAARLDAQDAQLADHETRITGLEQRFPLPAANPQSAASGVKAIDTKSIYARLNNRPINVRATALMPPTAVQTSADPILNARAIHDRNNAAAAARAGRHR